MADNKNTQPTQNKVNENKQDVATPAAKENNTPATVLEQVGKVFSNDKPSTKEEPKAVKIDAKYLKNVPATAFPIISDLNALVEDIKKNGSDAQKALVSSLEKYIDAMSPGKRIEGKDGMMKQYSLWRAIKRVLEDDPYVEFKGLWIILLAFVKENIKGCFAHTHRYRFTEYWTRSQAELDGLNNILNLLVIGCEEGKRLHIGKEVRLSYTLLNGFKDEARKRIFSYYQNV